MAGSGQTKVDFDESFFDAIMHSAGVESLCRQKAEAVLQQAKATAPVDTGDYRDGIEIKVVHHAHRARTPRTVGRALRPTRMRLPRSSRSPARWPRSAPSCPTHRHP